MKKWLLIFSLVIILFSCQQNPLSTLEDPVIYSDTYSATWVLYDDVLNTLGGDILYYPSDPGPEIMLLENTENKKSAYSKNNYFHFTWNGGKVYWAKELPDNPTSRYQYSYCGISFIVATSAAYYNMTPARDLSGGKYVRLTFYARGELSDGVYAKFEGPGNVGIKNLKLTKTWKKYSIDLKDMYNVKDFFKVTMEYPAAAADPDAPLSKGGYIDFDLVTYEK